MDGSLKIHLQSLGFHLGECASIRQRLVEAEFVHLGEGVDHLVLAYKVSVNKVISECEHIIFNSNDHELVFRIENILASYNLIRDRINR